MRVLIFSASVGAGHLRAAQAVELALRHHRPDVEVRNIDILSLTNATFRRLYGQAYIDLVNRAPHLLGFMYDMLDKPPTKLQRKAAKFRVAFQKLNLRPFLRLLRESPPDLVINTHFLPAEIIAGLKSRGDISFPQVTATTDFECHRLWINQPCERYFTATAEGAAGLAAWGIPRDTISVTGIPIHSRFAQPLKRKDALEKLSLPGDRPVLLQLAGGFGVGPIERIYRSILEVGRPVDLIVVAGRNAEARNQLAAIPVPPQHRVRILGFTDEMDVLLAAADIVLSKPGGLTTSETLARGAAMAIVDPIPGQETRNSDYLLENGAAIKINNIATLAHKVEALLADPGRLAQLKANAVKLGRPNAARDVVEQSLALRM